MESAGISRALEIAQPRYEGIGNALRMARELSKENIALSSNHMKMERGPKPQHIPRSSLVSESDRGLQAVYG